MKKVILTALCLCLLCGCKNTRSVMAENGRSLVSAIGVDVKGEKVFVSVETIVVNSQDTEQAPKATVLEGEGATFNLALDSAVTKSAKPLDFSHCAIIIFGENIGESIKSEVYKFCLENEQITVSVGFAETKSASELLKVKPVSDIAVGYEIVSMLETANVGQGIAFNNRFYEIENARLKGKAEKPLPRFEVKESFFLVGEKN